MKMNQKPIIEITVNENAVIHFELWPEIAPIAAQVLCDSQRREYLTEEPLNVWNRDLSFSHCF